MTDIPDAREQVLELLHELPPTYGKLDELREAISLLLDEHASRSATLDERQRQDAVVEGEIETLLVQVQQNVQTLEASVAALEAISQWCEELENSLEGRRDAFAEDQTAYAAAAERFKNAQDILRDAANSVIEDRDPPGGSEDSPVIPDAHVPPIAGGSA